jgi:hypothetical protein
MFVNKDKESVEGVVKWLLGSIDKQETEIENLK